MSGIFNQLKGKTVRLLCENQNKQGNKSRFLLIGECTWADSNFIVLKKANGKAHFISPKYVKEIEEVGP